MISKIDTSFQYLPNIFSYFHASSKKIQSKFVRYKKSISKIKNSILLIQEPQQVKNLSVYFFTKS